VFYVRYTPLEAGPLFEWAVEGFVVRTRPTSAVDVALQITDSRWGTNGTKVTGDV
jgi:hypothetical protein